MYNNELEEYKLTIDMADISIMRKFRYLLYTGLKKRDIKVIHIENLKHELINTKLRQKEFNRVLMDAKKYTNANIIINCNSVDKKYIQLVKEKLCRYDQFF